MRQRVEEVLGLIGLGDHIDKSEPTELSGGQRRRVALARAMAARPPCSLSTTKTSRLESDYVHLGR